MKHLLNTLYVLTPGSYLALDGQTVAVKIENSTAKRVPLHTLEGIVAFGSVGCSPALMRACTEHSVSISFLSRSGRFVARVQGPVSGNVLVRREQYRRADSLRESAEIAGRILGAKIANSRAVLLRATRDHPNRPGSSVLVKAADQIREILGKLDLQSSIDALRGIEGEAAAQYFAVFDHLIICQKEHFRFERRSRRPPLDNVNALLSFLYSLLLHDAASALESVGLDPAVGFLHRDRPGRLGLALDLMEELRPVLADRLALTLINRQQVRQDGFLRTESGAVVMTDDTRRTVLATYHDRKRSEIEHPFLKEKMPVGLLFFAQALLLARHLRGDTDAYPPFFWR